MHIEKVMAEALRVIAERWRWLEGSVHEDKHDWYGLWQVKTRFSQSVLLRCARVRKSV